MQPTFSIITRTASRLLFLARVRDGLAAAALPRGNEWIICDDAPEGTPGMAAFVEDAQHRLPMYVRLVETRSASRPNAANGGLAAAKGDLVHIHDDDDTVEPYFYQRTAGFLERNPQFGGVCVLCDRVDEELIDGQLRFRRRRPHYHEIRSIGLLSMATTQTIPPIGFVAHRSVLHAVGPFNEALSVCEDHEYFLRFLLKADIGILRERLASFHHRPSSGGDFAANSLASTDHEAQDACFRSAMLRRDMEEGRAGLGWLLILGEMNRAGWRRKALLRRLGRYLPDLLARKL